MARAKPQSRDPQGGDLGVLAPLRETPAAIPQLALDFGEAPAPTGNGGDNAYLRLKALLAQRGSLTNGDVQASLGISAEEARALLRRLVDEGVAAVVG